MITATLCMMGESSSVRPGTLLAFPIWQRGADTHSRRSNVESLSLPIGSPGNASAEGACRPHATQKQHYTGKAHHAVAIYLQSWLLLRSLAALIAMMRTVPGRCTGTSCRLWGAGLC